MTYSFIDESGETRLVGSISPPPGGGSQSFKIVAVPFTFASVGLTDGAFEAYTPTAGEFLLDAWFSVTTRWNGNGPGPDTTPRGDIAPWTSVGDPPSLGGMFANGAGPIDMGLSDTSTLFPGFLCNDENDQWSLLGNALTSGYRTVPGLFLNANPVCICVSTNGFPGNDPASSQGVATLYLAIASAAVAP